MDVPFGYCHCGCGQKTKIATRTHRRYGWIKGVPFRYLFGHRTNERKTTQYAKVGEIYEHRKIAADELGAPLADGAIVHHIDGNTKNNDPSNIRVFGSNSEHAKFHAQQKAFRECGHGDWRKCCFCHTYDDPENMFIRKSGQSAYHRKCYNNYMRLRKRGVAV